MRMESPFDDCCCLRLRDRHTQTRIEKAFSWPPRVSFYSSKSRNVNLVLLFRCLVYVCVHALIRKPLTCAGMCCVLWMAGWAFFLRLFVCWQPRARDSVRRKINARRQWKPCINRFHFDKSNKTRAFSSILLAISAAHTLKVFEDAVPKPTTMHKHNIVKKVINNGTSRQTVNFPKFNLALHSAKTQDSRSHELHNYSRSVHHNESRKWNLSEIIIFYSLPSSHSWISQTFAETIFIRITFIPH